MDYTTENEHTETYELTVVRGHKYKKYKSNPEKVKIADRIFDEVATEYSFSLQAVSGPIVIRNMSIVATACLSECIRRIIALDPAFKTEVSNRIQRFVNGDYGYDELNEHEMPLYPIEDIRYNESIRNLRMGYYITSYGKIYVKLYENSSAGNILICYLPAEG